MDVLQHDPVAFFVAFLDPSPSYFILTLSERNAKERFAGLDSIFFPFSFDQFFNLLDGIGAGRQDEEDGNLWL